MAKWAKALVCIAFSFMFIFMTFGYAAVTDTLEITGDVSTKVQEGVFITEVSPNAEYGVGFIGTVLTSKVQLENSSSSVSFTITVFNNSEEDYYFDAIIAYNNYYDNPNITYTHEGLKRPYTDVDGVWVEDDPEVTKLTPKTFHTFTLTFQYKDKLDSSITSNVLNSSINFLFKTRENINPDQTIAAVEGTLEKFKEILNTTEDRTSLLNAMTNQGAGIGGTGPYIGNVTGSTASDSTLLKELFDGQLSLNIDGVDTDITLLVKQRNIDNNERTGNSYKKDNWIFGTSTEKGCEMTLFMTPDKCTGSTVTVYAVVFTCPADTNGNPTGEWYQVGGMYKGEAPVRAYEGGNGTGSFRTDNWRSKGDTTVADNLTIESIIQALS